ncbi:rhodanese-like domain-containing protein [Flavobacterium crassostreae]|uniref:Sulfurtransferase n=1 Tax=Flavobacterium crassostreae TaxID=1763534 RepID=A0A1B9DMI7_9FLAO|nr:rhodanese-like domain-containing protein [Flavobacterium crassostreae]OCB70905.1 sulfurtransferase [Flavobacterium crassostreae]
MWTRIKKLLGWTPAVDYVDLLQKGAVIIDVRTASEFQQGHIKQAINMPLNGLNLSISKIKKDTIIITCCASGMRSAAAKNTLKSIGFTTVYNGGGWSSLQNKISH